MLLPDSGARGFSMSARIRLLFAVGIVASGSCKGVPTGIGTGPGGKTSTVGGPCTTDGNCMVGELCGIGGKCVGLAPCTADGDCPTGQLCDVGGVCSGSPTCTSDTSCPTGQLCDVGGFCRGLTPCVSDSSCPSGELCDADGYCRGLTSTASVLTWQDATPATGSPPFRSDFPMSFDAARQVTVLFGGCCSNGGGFFGDTWEWNGTAWSQPMPETSPSARAGAGLAWDARRTVGLLFGGCASSTAGCTPQGDTWEWDGTNWSQLSPATSPPPRADHHMAYDSGRGVTVLFGGCTSYNNNAECTQTVNDTWEWNGVTWTHPTPATSPPARFSHGLVFDSDRGVSVMFGGCQPVNGQCIDPNNLMNDTWEWNGQAWTQMAVAPDVPRRQNFGMAYDSVRQVTLIFGGTSDVGFNTNDTWEWNGSRWAPLSPTLSPGPRNGDVMSYDSARSETVMFSGSGTGLLNDTWLLPSSAL